MAPSSLLLFALALAVNAGTPGPSIAALTARVLARGLVGILPFLAAMWIGEALWLACAVLGLSYIAKSFFWAFLALKLAGVGYLLYLAWHMWSAPAQVDEGSLPADGSATSLFLTGIALTLGNPKIMIFYLALLPAFLDLGTVTVSGWLELTATLLVVLAAVDLGYVALATQARRLMRSPRVVRLMNRTCAGVMAGAAAALAAESL